MTTPVSSQGLQLPRGTDGADSCWTPRRDLATCAPGSAKVRLEAHGQSLLGALFGGPIPGLGLLLGGFQGWSLSVELDGPGVVAPNPGGYCKAPPRPTDGGHGKPGASGGATGKAKGDLAFLDDKSLPIEEKLFRFMLLMQKKADKELEDFMRASAPGGEGGAKASDPQSGGGAKKGGGGGLLGGLLGGGGGGGLLGGLLGGGGGGGILGGLPGGGGGLLGGLLGGGGDLLGGLFGGEGGGLGSILGDDGIKKAVGSLGGPLLAAAVSAVGLPMLAPIANKVGSALGEKVVDGVAGGGSKASGGSGAGAGGAKGSGSAGGSAAGGSSTGKADGKGMSDQERMLRLQHLLETQQKMFSAISNAMKSLHDTQMTAIHNFR